MNWYLIHTKPRQEKLALANLMQQDYECYMPTIQSEKILRGMLTVQEEPLFPRYLFVRLGTGQGAKSWSPIRSTKGVSKLVSFGSDPARVDERLVEAIRASQKTFIEQPQRLFTPGERVRVVEGPFSGVEGIYQIADGNRRVMVLIELLSKPVQVGVDVTKLRRVV